MQQGLFRGLLHERVNLGLKSGYLIEKLRAGCAPGKHPPMDQDDVEVVPAAPYAWMEVCSHPGYGPCAPWKHCGSNASSNSGGEWVMHEQKLLQPDRQYT